MYIYIHTHYTDIHTWCLCLHVCCKYVTMFGRIICYVFQSSGAFNPHLSTAWPLRYWTTDVTIGLHGEHRSMDIQNWFLVIPVEARTQKIVGLFSDTRSSAWSEWNTRFCNEKPGFPWYHIIIIIIHHIYMIVYSYAKCMLIFSMIEHSCSSWMHVY